MIRYTYKDYTIEVYNDSAYNYNSTDNKIAYLNHYFGDNSKEYPVSYHGVKLYQNDNEIYSCILIASGGATTIHKTSSILDKDLLLVCCCDTVFCLNLPTLQLSWKLRADRGTCFEIYKLKNDFLVHGELEITCFTSEGKIKWQFGGTDIFVTLEEENEFKIYKDYIWVRDFMKNEYKLDFDGKVIE